MLLNLAQSKKLLFFGGKGGTGKTTVSAATALALANSGRRVLLVSTDPAHNLGHLFGQEVGSEARRLAAGLDALELDPAQVVDAHLQEVSAALHQLMPVAQHGEIDKHLSLSRDAPGMQEAALLEKMAMVIEEGLKTYDHVIFDTAPSGHTARLMALPEMMAAWTEGLIKRRERADKFARIVQEMGEDHSVEDKVFGDGADKEDEAKNESRIRRILLRRRQRFSQMRQCIRDSEITAFVIVLAAERLPVLETIDLHQSLSQSGVNVAALVVNKRVPTAQAKQPTAQAKQPTATETTPNFLSERHQQEQQHLQTLSQALGHLLRQDLHLAPQDILGIPALEALAASMQKSQPDS